MSLKHTQTHKQLNCISIQLTFMVALFTSDKRFATEDNNELDLIFPITTLHDTMPLYKYLKFSKFKLQT